MGRDRGGRAQGSGDPMRFGYPDVGPRFDPGRPDRASTGLASGRFWLRLVAGVILVAMAVLTITGNGDTAAGTGWLLLGPLVIVLGLVELTALASANTWDDD